MAVVEFRIETQETMDVLNGTGTAATGPLSAAFDPLLRAFQVSSQFYAIPIRWEISGDTVLMVYPNDTVASYSGVVLSNPNATHGTGTATDYTFSLGNDVSYFNRGQYNFTYDVVNGALVVKMQSVTKTIESLATLLPPESRPTLFGDISTSATGNWKTDPNGDVSGSLSHLQVPVASLGRYFEVDGNFSVSANTAGVASGASHSAVTGILTDYSTSFIDSSSFAVSAAHAEMRLDDQLDLRFLSDARHFTGDDVIHLMLRSDVRLVNDLLLAAGDGNDVIANTGGGDKLRIDMGAGNDQLQLYGPIPGVDGGSGRDTVYLYHPAAETVTARAVANGISITDPSGVHLLNNVERVELGVDGLAFDFAGNAGQAYRIYQAALDRQPDIDGLSYWMRVMDNGSMLHAVAEGFINSDEFRALYGNNPNDNDFLTRLYGNVLHRKPDQGGFDYWQHALHHNVDRAEVLALFSESAENQTQVIDDIQGGIAYQGLLHLNIYA